MHEDETISGTMTLGMSKQAMTMLSSMGESFAEEAGLDSTRDLAPEAEAGWFEEDEFFEADDIPGVRRSVSR